MLLTNQLCFYFIGIVLIIVDLIINLVIDSAILIRREITMSVLN